MLLGDWVVLFQRQLLFRVHRVLLRIVCSVTSLFAHQTNQFSLRILLCHLFNSLGII